MAATATQKWLERLGYSAEPAVLHERDRPVAETHPYGLEIRALLNPAGAIRAQAVFDVEGVPTVVFVGDTADTLSQATLDSIRQRIWNQNLATIVISIEGENAIALPARKLPDAAQTLALSDARPDGPYSATDIAAANLSRRMPDWFDVKARVDRKLLDNLALTVSKLADGGFQCAGRCSPPPLGRAAHGAAALSIVPGAP